MVVWYLKTRPTRQSRNNAATISKGARPISLLKRLTVRLLLLLLGRLLRLLGLSLLGLLLGKGRWGSLGLLSVDLMCCGN